MTTPSTNGTGRHVHIVTLACKDAAHAARCLEALGAHGRPDALACHCLSYEFGLREGSTDTVQIVERWNRWDDLDELLRTKVVPALPTYNQLLKRPFDPTTDTLRVTLSAA